MYTRRVPVSSTQILKIIRTFKAAYADITKEIATATDFGVQNRRQILAQIETILEELGVDVLEFLEKELPKYYEIGAKEAISQLSNTGASVKVAAGFNRIHQQAVAMLVDDTARAFAEGMTGVGRNIRNLFGKELRNYLTQKMAKGIISGEALDDARRMIVTALKKEGFVSLIDRGGREWSLDRYSEMLFRTKAVEARNRGLINRVVENGYDLVQVSAHPGACELCTPWEGKILSITGKTEGYKTVTEAESMGLFHPNCRHALNLMVPSLAKQTKAYDYRTKRYE